MTTTIGPGRKRRISPPNPAVRRGSGNSRSSRSKSNPYVLWGAVLSGLLLLGIFIGAILWFFNRKSASQEMMMYLPDDCDEVSGINLGHLQKYPEFYKSCESASETPASSTPADIFCDALGEKTNDVVDYVVQGVGRAGGTGQEVAATVFHTKVDYDTTLLSKLSGANKGTRNGVDYYLISDIPGLNYGGIKVFAPTKRLVVFCRADTPDAKFDAMLNGNKDNPDATPFKRGGQLSKAIIRGTAWKFMIYGRSVTKFAGPEAPTGGGGGLGGGQENDEDAIRREVAEVLQNAQGCGYKASVGSREVRGEWVVWYKDSDAANSMLKKWKEKEWIKDEEKDPPRYWKALANKSGGGKTAANVLRDGLAFRQSGETFSIRTSMDVNLVKGSPGQLVSAVNGQNAFGPPNGAPTGPPTGGTGPPGKGPPRAPPPPPPSGRLPYNASVTTPTGHSPWPPAHPAAPLAVLVSGGVDQRGAFGRGRSRLPGGSSALRPHRPFLGSRRTRPSEPLPRRDPRPHLQPLRVLEQPVADLYGDHWGLTGQGVPAAGTPDEEVFLPGRNVLLLAKSLLWCHLNRVPEIAMAPLAANPFPDATPEFFRDFARL